MMQNIVHCIIFHKEKESKAVFLPTLLSILKQSFYLSKTNKLLTNNDEGILFQITDTVTGEAL